MLLLLVVADPFLRPVCILHFSLRRSAAALDTFLLSILLF
jgi:hypothetical protein